MSAIDLSPQNQVQTVLEQGADDPAFPDRLRKRSGNEPSRKCPSTDELISVHSPYGIIRPSRIGLLPGAANCGTAR